MAKTTAKTQEQMSASIPSRYTQMCVGAPAGDGGGGQKRRERWERALAVSVYSKRPQQEAQKHR